MTKNYYVDVYQVAGLPTWSFTNPDKDDRWMGSSGMPAVASLILYSPTDRSNYPNPTSLTLYWGSGAHHRHHGGYQLAEGKMVVSIDWAKPAVAFPSGANVTPLSGQIPWAPNSKGSLMKQLVAHAQDADVTSLISEQSGWYKVVVSSDASQVSGSAAVGSMNYDLFIVKATDGMTYLRVNISSSSMGFDKDEEQQFVRFGVLVGDQSQVQLFTAAGEHDAPAWNDAAAATLDQNPDSTVSIPDGGFAPTELQQRTGSYSKTTSSGWNIGGNIGGSSGNGGDGGSGGGDSGGDGGGGAADAAGAVAA